MLQFILAELSSSRDFHPEIGRILSGYLIFAGVPSGTLTYMPLFTKDAVTEHPSSYRTKYPLHSDA